METIQHVFTNPAVVVDVTETIASTKADNNEPGSTWSDSRMGTAYLAVISVILLVGQIDFVHWFTDQAFKSRIHPVRQQDCIGHLNLHFVQYGSLTIAVHKILRLASTLALFVLTAATIARHGDDSNHGPLWAEASALLYTTVIALLTTIVSAPTSRILSSHATFITLAFVGIYVYRDIWPLLTFTLIAQDKKEGQLLWARFALAVLSSIVFPAVEPYPYIPLGPEISPSPVQTASLLSFITFWFLEPVIRKANHVPHLLVDQLPPLMDSDAAPRLAQVGAKYLDPHNGMLQNSTIYWGLVQLFPTEWVVLFTTSFLLAFFELCGPVGINRLLNYLETNGEDAFVRPWVWLVWMGLTPLAVRIVSELFNYYVTQLTVKAEGIITTIVVEHSFRIRVMAGSTHSQAPTAVTVANFATEETFSGNEIATRAHLSTAAESEATVMNNGADTPTRSAPPLLSSEDLKDEKDNFVGRINNLVTSDAANIYGGCRDLCPGIIIPSVTITLAMTFLYAILGWSSIAGLAAMLMLMPIPAFLASLMEGVMDQKMKATDERVGTITEMMGVIRMVKLFGWETKIKQNVATKRASEIEMVWRGKKIELILDVVNHILPLIHMVVTYLMYTLVMKRPLSASIVFSAMSAFELVRFQITTFTERLPNLVRARVSVQRLSKFLWATELLDGITADEVNDRNAAHHGTEDIGFHSATFTWSNNVIDGASTPSKQRFRLRIDDKLVFHKNAINLIIGELTKLGPTGSGKTSLLMALLGEMHFVPSIPASWFSLPRSNGVAYAAQESWVLNTTIRNNVIFGAPFDQIRYEKTIHQCGLERDILLFEAGDATEVGEKGVTLSGGQKARLTLARAVYSSAGIVLLDDVLAALDVHTARWIVEKCFKGDLIRGRTVLLVTHNVSMANPIADFVVALGNDGRVLSQGSLLDASKKDLDIFEREPEQEILFPNSESAKIKAGKLIVEEETAIGHVGWPAFKLLTTALGGNWPTTFWTLFLSIYSAVLLALAFELWWLGWWARQYAEHESSHVQVTFYLGVYGIVVLVAIILFVTCKIIYLFGTFRASETIHDRLVTSLIGSTFRWLDTTPLSRMVTRCTQDIQAVDNQLPSLLWAVLDLTISMFISLGIVMVFSPAFLAVGMAFGGLGVWLGRQYMRAQLPVRREWSKAKAPVLATVDDIITGLVSIRAYAAEDQFRQQAYTHINRHTRTARTAWNLDRWIAFRVSLITSTFTPALGWYLLYGNHFMSVSTIGFVLVQGTGFCEKILYWTRLLNEFQAQANSLERIQEYLTVDQEPGQAESGQPPAHWPTSSELQVENISARYSPNGPKVLHDISFFIKAGQRIGVAGRTGSGKSSLALSLLRCIYTEGNVYFNGILTSAMNLDALRSKITIIPQSPELMSGTLRRNLDMFEEHDDAVLNDALRAAGLFSLQTQSDENKLSLDSSIASGGSNLSVGQRQIIALARALVRQSKLLILDEATSAIDYETDSIIQTSLRKELGPDVTVITIAHRLQTIMDSDMIMVLDAGRLVEFDSPKALLQKDNSLLRRLVNESVDKTALHEMAGSEHIHL